VHKRSVDAYEVLIVLARPESRSGQVYLRNKNYFTDPKIDYKFFEKGTDVDRIIDGN
jgi:hypothetical protein